MPDYSIEVAVEPDGSRFPEHLAAIVGKAEARQDPVEVELEAKLGRDFGRDAQRKVKTALARLDAQVLIAPQLSRGFRRDVERMAKEALAGQGLEIPFAPTLGRGFRRDLQRAVKEATAGQEVQIPVQAILGPGFRAKLQRAINEALSVRPLTADVSLQVDKRSYARFVADINERLAVITETRPLQVRSDLVPGFTEELAAKVGAAVNAAEVTEAASIEIRADVAPAVEQIAAIDAASGKAATSSGRLGTAAKLAGVGLLAAGAAAVGAGALLFKVGESFDSAFDKIRTVTGKTGPALAGLKGDFREVAATVPSDFDSIATAVAGVNQRLGLTGTVGQEAAGQLLNLSRITGTDLDANLTAAAGALQSFAIPAKDIPGALDELFRASQASGVGVDSLTSKLQGSGAALRVAGFDFSESAALIAQLQRAGIPAERVIGSLSIAARKLAAAGKDPAVEIGKLVDQIKAAKTPTEALGIAQGTFGRGAVAITDAIRSGKFELADFLGVVKGGDSTIAGTAKATADAAESWQLLKNNLSLTLEQPAASFFGSISDAVAGLTPALEKLGPSIALLVGGLGTSLSGLISGIVPIVGQLAGVLGATLAPVIAGLADALAPLVKLIAKDFSKALAVMSPALSKFGTIVGGALADLAPPLVQVFEESFAAIEPVLPQIADVLVQVADAFAEMLPSVAALVLPLVRLQNIFFGKVTVPILLVIAQALLAIARITIPLARGVAGILAAGLDKLVDLFGKLAGVGAKVAGVVGGVWNAIAGGGGKTKEAAADVGALTTGTEDLGGAAADAGIEIGDLGDVSSTAGGQISDDLGGGIRTAAEQFVAFHDAAQIATDAFTAFLDASQGKGQTLLDASLSVIDAGKSYLDIQKQVAEGTLSQTEGQLKSMQLVLGEQHTVQATFGQLAIDAGGNFDVFSEKARNFKLTLISQVADALGVSTEKASELVDTMVQIPTAKEFNLITNTPEVQAAIDSVTNPDVPYEALVTIRTHLDRDMSALLRGLDQDFLVTGGGGRAQIATGGLVRGPNINRDVVPAMLTPGEVVVNRGAAQKWGPENLLALNAGRTPPGWTIPRFAAGGLVGWHPQEDAAGWNWRSMGNGRASKEIMGAFKNGWIGDINQDGLLTKLEWDTWERFRKWLEDRAAFGLPAFTGFDAVGGLAGWTPSEDAAGWNWKTMGNGRASQPIMAAFPNGWIGDLDQNGVLTRSEWDTWEKFAKWQRAHPAFTGFATGGLVGGLPSAGDSVAALLTPGEVVINRASADLFGREALLKINAGLVPDGWHVPKAAAIDGLAHRPVGLQAPSAPMISPDLFRFASATAPGASPGGVVESESARLARFERHALDLIDAATRSARPPIVVNGAKAPEETGFEVATRLASHDYLHPRRPAGAPSR